MLKKSLFLLGALLLTVGCNTPRETLVQSDFNFADKQLRVALHDVDSLHSLLQIPFDSLTFPRSILPDSALRLVNASDWCSGFFPGELWLMYQYTNDPYWKEQAERYTKALENQQYNGSTHDLGFMMFCSYGNGYRLAPNDHYKEVLIQSARSLASRFNERIGCIRSWDSWGPTFRWQYPVIIDNMMNLELLFWATRATGDSTYYRIAVTHADTTMKNHFRADYTSYHVVDYDTVSGRVRGQGTHQGYADNSAWARGQAWGLYGYTLCFRETKDPRYLAQAEKIASAIFGQPTMTEDLVPYWDYNAPDIPKAPRDASAAAVAASALYELSTLAAEGAHYKELADRIVESLSKSYLNAPGSAHGFLLSSSTGHHPEGSEVNVPIVYADYYFLEALLRKQALEKNTTK